MLRCAVTISVHRSLKYFTLPFLITYTYVFADLLRLKHFPEQIRSHERILDISAIDEGKPYSGIFIRAPAITSINDKEVEVLARVSIWLRLNTHTIFYWLSFYSIYVTALTCYSVVFLALIPTRRLRPGLAAKQEKCLKEIENVVYWRLKIVIMILWNRMLWLQQGKRTS